MEDQETDGDVGDVAADLQFFIAGVERQSLKHVGASPLELPVELPHWGGNNKLWFIQMCVYAKRLTKHLPGKQHKLVNVVITDYVFSPPNDQCFLIFIILGTQYLSHKENEKISSNAC